MTTTRTTAKTIRRTAAAPFAFALAAAIGLGTMGASEARADGGDVALGAVGGFFLNEFLHAQRPAPRHHQPAYQPAPSYQQPAYAPPPSVEQRLARLEDLRRRGYISDAEYRATRAQILSEI